MAKKFNAPQANPYATQPQEPEQEQFYRFNAKLPYECKAYLQEMAWRTTVAEHRSISITEYLTRLVLADMAAHPDWKESLDILNK